MLSKPVTSLGERIRNARLERNLTQKELAKLLGVHSDTIYLLENDKNVLHVKYMIKLEQILGCEICRYDKYLNFAKDTALHIKTLRNTQGLSKEEFSRYYEISISTINSWESGRNFITRKLYYSLFTSK